MDAMEMSAQSSRLESTARFGALAIYIIISAE